MPSRTRCERIAHRGAKLEFAENTLPAFSRAVERGADAIELDVHATADGVVVVHHDEVLGRYANDLSGVPIADLSWERLSRVRLSGKTGIPSLAEVLLTLPKNVAVYVEIKGRGIESAVASVLSGAECPCAVHSFDHEAVAEFARLLPRIPRGILFEDDVTNVLEAMQRTNARDVWPKASLVDAALVERVHGAAGRVIVWTVNSRDLARELIDLGVDGICTDDLRLLDSL